LSVVGGSQIDASSFTRLALEIVPVLALLFTMRQPIVLAMSLGVNLLLGALVYHWWRSPVNETASSPPIDRLSLSSSNTIKTNVVVRRLHFKWEDVESDDYPTYVANLREIGCPESTIRDIIVADVNQLYAKKQANEIVSPDQQWWRSEPDPALVQAASKKLDALEKERRDLLTNLLGPGWVTSTERTLEGTPLTGPVLGNLSKETKEAVQQINVRANQRLQTFFDSQGNDGGPVDQMELSRLQQQTREELARVLTPEQLEEYLLRYSQNANSLRNELRGIAVIPEEFRAMFQIRDPIDQQIQLNYSGNEPASVQQRLQLDLQRETALQTVLGPERYQAYRLHNDPLYREAQSTAQKLGAPAEAVTPIYQVNQLSEAARERIRTDPKLSSAQKSEVLKIVQEEQQKTLLEILGKETFQRYEQEQAP
jgi:hypothetical protein